MVGGLVLADRAPRAGEHAEDPADDRPDEDQAQADADPPAHLVVDRAPLPRAPEVALHDAARPRAEALEDRRLVVDVQLRQPGIDDRRRRRRVAPLVLRARVEAEARQHVRQARRDRHEDQRVQQPPQQELCQGRIVTALMGRPDALAGAARAKVSGPVDSRRSDMASVDTTAAQSTNGRGGGAEIPVENPATGEVIAHVADLARRARGRARTPRPRRPAGLARARLRRPRARAAAHAQVADGQRRARRRRRSIVGDRQDARGRLDDRARPTTRRRAELLVQERREDSSPTRRCRSARSRSRARSSSRATSRSGWSASSAPGTTRSSTPSATRSPRCWPATA